MQEVEKKYSQRLGVCHTDNLTGLLNHGIFSLMAEQEIARARRYGHEFSCALLGMDNFSAYNRKFGRVSGDIALKSIGRIVQENLRRTDIAARLSGDVMAILFPETQIDEAVIVMDRIRDAVRNLYDAKLTASAGVIPWQENVNDEDTYIQTAYDALFRAKQLGKDTTWGSHRSTIETRSDDNAHVLLVDDEPKNLKLLEATLLPMGHRIYKAGNGPEALDILKNQDIDIVLLDVMMPDMDGFEVCSRIRHHPDLRLIPVMLITALDDAQSKLKGLEAGANDFITKPPNRVDLMARTQSLIRLKRVTSKLTGIENVLFSLVRSIEAKDPYTRGHAERVANLAVTLGRRMDLRNEELEALRYAGYLHDIGKIGTPREILSKPGRLTDAEYKVVQSHPVVGHRIVLPLQRILGHALDAILYHHERLDGSGYPDRLSGEKIPLNARIMAVADCYDAMTTSRPYRSAMPREKAIAILKKDCADGKLDQKIVDILVRELGMEPH